jgi:Na+-exporting ATPase
MGETVLLAVEETSPKADEPPICGSKDPRNAPNQRPSQPNPSGGNTPSALYAPHTLTVEEVAEKLGVDIQ